jgi:hypothetical protein
VPWQFALHEDELDEADLPGRPPHTIVCVRAKGKTQSTVVEELMCGPNVVDNDPCNSYDLYLCVYIPVEIIVRDCAGFLYCLTSAMSQIVRIPLTTRVRNLKDTQIYLKARVRLCRTKVVRYPNSGSGDTLNDGIHHPPTAEYDEQDTADNDVRPCGAAGNRWQTTRDSEIATDPPLGLADTNEPGPYDPLNDQRENRPVADDDIARNVGCGKLGYKQSTGEKDGFGSATLPDGHIVTRALPTVYLDVLIEACVMRLVPFGVVGDPSAAVGSTQATFLNP